MTRLTHGMAGTTEYRTWTAIRGRCNSPTNDAYQNYGGRGITVCERWNSFDAFYEDMGPRPFGMTLDRRDNNKGYSPDNCRWATKSEQSLNRRNVRLLTIGGRTQTIAEWARENGIKPKSAWQRIKCGWEPAHAVSLPPMLTRAGIQHGKHFYETPAFGVERGVEFAELEAA